MKKAITLILTLTLLLGLCVFPGHALSSGRAYFMPEPIPPPAASFHVPGKLWDKMAYAVTAQTVMKSTSPVMMRRKILNYEKVR